MTLFVRISTDSGRHSPVTVQPGASPAATAGPTYLRTVLRFTPRLADSSCCDRPAYQWIKISTTSITSKVLLATVAPPRCSATRRRFASTEDQSGTDTHVLPQINSVTARWGNYVTTNPSHRGNFMIADTLPLRRCDEDGVGLPDPYGSGQKCC